MNVNTAPEKIAEHTIMDVLDAENAHLYTNHAKYCENTWL